MPGAKVKTIRIVQYAQRLHDIVIIMQRFAHTHQNKVGYVVNGSVSNGATERVAPSRQWCISQFSSKEEYLCDNLPCCEMTIKTHLTCCAKCTPKSASSLCRYTYRRACAAFTNRRIEHKHRFDQPSIIKLQQDFACAAVFRVQFTP